MTRIYSGQLRKIMWERRLTVAALVKKSGTNRNLILRMLDGENVGLDNLLLIADSLELSLDYLCRGEGWQNVLDDEDAEFLEAYYNAPEDIRGAVMTILLKHIS